jgi:hypothetical protein
VKRVFVFVLLVMCLDLALGSLLGRLYRRTLTGARGGLLNYALTKDADILVLGSSRAEYHVMPPVLHQKLSLTAFNAGVVGHDFLYSVMLFDLWKRSHAPPQVILLHMDIESMLQRDNELEAAQIFAPYIGDSALVRQVLYSADPYKRLEYLSRTYRYNGKVFAMAKNLFVHPDPGFDGFIAAHGRLIPTSETRTLKNALDQDATALEQARRPFWQTKVRYLRDLAEFSAQHHTRLFLFHTPRFELDVVAHRIWTDRLQLLIADLPGVEFIDICEATHPETFARGPDLYSDANHLNERGAAIFSSLLADELAEALRRPPPVRSMLPRNP